MLSWILQTRGLPLLDTFGPLPDTHHSEIESCVCVCLHHWTFDLVKAPYCESCLLACPRHLALSVAFSRSSGGLWVIVVELSDILGHCQLCCELLLTSATNSTMGDKTAAINSAT